MSLIYDRSWSHLVCGTALCFISVFNWFLGNWCLRLLLCDGGRIRTRRVVFLTLHNRKSCCDFIRNCNCCWGWLSSLSELFLRQMVTASSQPAIYLLHVSVKGIQAISAIWRQSPVPVAQSFSSPHSGARFVAGNLPSKADFLLSKSEFLGGSCRELRQFDHWTDLWLYFSLTSGIAGMINFSLFFSIGRGFLNSNCSQSLVFHLVNAENQKAQEVLHSQLSFIKEYIPYMFHLLCLIVSCLLFHLGS